MLQPDGKLTFANVGGFINNFILIRINPNLSLDSTFGSGGVVQTSFNGGAIRAQANGIVLDPNGKIAVSGGDNAGNNSAGNFFAAHYNSDGSLDTTFGSNGQITLLSSDAPIPNTRKAGGALVRQADSKYIVAIENGFGAIRLLPTGALDQSFGVGGFANFNSFSGYPGSILLQTNGRIILPGQQQDGADPAPHGIRMLRLLNQSVIQLSAATYSIDEGGGHASIVVNRIVDTSGASTVHYATSDTAGLTPCNVFNGIASSRCDYATTIGTLQFAAGETSKTIFIPIVDDGYAEGPETFTLTLSNPQGATLGANSTATITIIDNDAGTGTNPLTDQLFFIRQQYIDFLGREPDPPGLSGWLDVLNNCGTKYPTPCDRIEVSSDFFRSAEFQARGYFIYLFYATIGRHPFYSEFMPDLAKVSGFLTDAQLEANKAAFVNEFMTRTEFQTKYGSLTDPAQYVDALLQTAGLPNHPTRNSWIAGLTNSTMTRGQVLRALVESSDVYNKYYNEAFVVMQYFGYLRRDPDALYTQWIDTLNKSGDYRTMINGFLNSTEYAKRFGP